MPCPAGLVFNPTAEPGPVCDWPTPELNEAVYQWCLDRGIVTEDQR